MFIMMTMMAKEIPDNFLNDIIDTHVCKISMIYAILISRSHYHNVLEYIKSIIHIVFPSIFMICHKYNKDIY